MAIYIVVFLWAKKSLQMSLHALLSAGMKYNGDVEIQKVLYPVSKILEETQNSDLNVIPYEKKRLCLVKKKDLCYITLKA